MAPELCDACSRLPELELLPFGKRQRCPRCQAEFLTTLSGARFRLPSDDYSVDPFPAPGHGQAVALVHLFLALAIVTGLALTRAQQAESTRQDRQVAFLANVPELELQDKRKFFDSRRDSQAELRRWAEDIAHRNKVEEDGYIHHLIQTRSDLAGLPFVMSPDCQLAPEKAQQLNAAAIVVREGVQASVSLFRAPRDDRDPRSSLEGMAADRFWGNWAQGFPDVRRSRRRIADDDAQPLPVFRQHSLSALSQILETESPAMRLGLAQHIADLKGPLTSRILTRRAIFDLDPEVRATALRSLALRPSAEAGPHLLEGLRHPWVFAAQNASRAIVALKAHDLVPRLIDLLDQPDPGAPFPSPDPDGPELVREVVKVNHHANCFLCHAPSLDPKDLVRARVPDPSVPIPQNPVEYYESPDGTFVRADITYLRQDFSMKLPVANHGPWPVMQRFDFFVRTRPATEQDLARWDESVKNRPDAISRHQIAILTALRELTGRDEGVVAAAWRK